MREIVNTELYGDHGGQDNEEGMMKHLDEVKKTDAVSEAKQRPG